MSIKKNNISFIILFVVHIFLFILVLNKKGVKSVFASLIPNIGSAYIFEYVVLNLFSAYIYYPKIFKKPYLDKIAGAVLSQAFFVPITATFITLFKLGTGWKLLFASYFMFVERIFLSLKVYKNRWWKTPFTGILTFVYFIISDEWYKKLLEGNTIVKVISIYLTFIVGRINILFIYAVTRVLRFGRRNSSWYEHFVLVPLYCLFVSSLYTFHAVKPTYGMKALTIGGVGIVDALLYKNGVLRFKKANWVLLLLPLHIISLLGGHKITSFYNKVSEDNRILNQNGRNVMQ